MPNIKKPKVYKGSQLPKIPEREKVEPVNEIKGTYGYEGLPSQSKEKAQGKPKEDTPAFNTAPRAMAYKISEPTYKLPGEGSRENYSNGTFREDNRAMQAGLIVDGGFGDLTGSYKGTSKSPTLVVELGANTMDVVSGLGDESGDVGGGSNSTVDDLEKRRHEREKENNKMLAETVSTKNIGANLSKRELT